MYLTHIAVRILGRDLKAKAQAGEVLYWEPSAPSPDWGTLDMVQAREVTTSFPPEAFKPDRFPTWEDLPDEEELIFFLSRKETGEVHLGTGEEEP